MCSNRKLTAILAFAVCVALGLEATAQVVRPVASRPASAARLAASRRAAASHAATRPAVAQNARQPKPGGTISVDQAEHDFGQIWTGGKLEHAFKITNTGKEELSITGVKPSCGCTVAGSYPRTLAPGATGEFPFTLTTTTINGPFIKRISVFSSDPAKPELTLTLKGKGVPQIAIEPRGVYLPGVFGDQVETKVVTIQNNLSTPLRLALDPLASSGPWSFDLAEKEAGKKYELTVKFNPRGVHAGSVRQTATLLTNIQAQHELHVFASAMVRERIEAEPSTLTIYAPASQPANVQGAAVGAAQSQPALAGAPASQPAEYVRTIHLRNYGEKPVKAVDAFCDDPALKVDLKEQTAGKAYSVAVSIPRAWTPSGHPEVMIRTDDPEKPVIRIPVVSTQSAQPYNRTANRTRPAEQLVGKEVPAFELTSMDGKPVSKQDLGTTAAVVDFFAPNCPHCKKQIPRVEALRKSYEAKGVRFLFVSETMGRALPDADVAAVMKRLGVDASVAIDHNNTVGRSFSVSSFPTMFVLNKAGKIEAVNIGDLRDLETRLKSQLDGILTGKSSASSKTEKASTAAPQQRPT